MNNFKLVMIGAMYENGGNTIQRTLDGHPELFVYPYESQLGTKFVQDEYSSTFPLKYRWPEFPLSGKFENDYELIIDEEMKVRTKTPFVSKFRDKELLSSDKERKFCFLELLQGKERNTANILEAFFKATFITWKNFNQSGKNSIYVGYSPVLTIDGEKFFQTYQDGHFIHIVRNPYSAYADTKKRALPLPLKRYIDSWCLNQHFALQLSKKYSDNFHLIRFEDLIEDPQKALKGFCSKIGISSVEKSLGFPSWNSEPLDEVYPWGTIRTPDRQANIKTANELSSDEKKEIFQRSNLYLRELGYLDIIDI